MTTARTLRRGEAVALSSLTRSRRGPGDLVIRVSGNSAPDVVALVLGPDGRVRGDADLAFYNQPSAAAGAVTVDPAAGSVRIRTSGLEDAVARVLIGCAGGGLDSGTGERLRVDVSHPGEGVLADAVIDVDRLHRAETVLEVYRWGTGWRLRLLGEGYAAGLAGLARDHGVDVDGASDAAPVAPPPPTPFGAPIAGAASFGSPPAPTSPYGSSFAAPPAWTSTPPAWTSTPTSPTSPVTTAPPAPIPSPRPRRKRRTGVLAGVAAVTLLAIGVGVGAAVSGDPATVPGAAPVAATTSAGPAVSSAATSASASPTPLAPASTAAVPVTSAAQATLALLSVKGRAPQTGYDRAQFGQAWADVDRNGCDTRNDVLRRDVTGATIDPRTSGCVVLTGTLADPYSGTTIAFTRGEQTSTAVQIDHVVALGDAWQTGAQQLDATRREQFANDPANLLAVDGSLNAQKGDGDAATWLPPNKAFRCSYVARQVAVKHAYGLWVTPAEHDAIARVLAACPGATAPPTPTVATTPPAPPRTSAAPPSTPYVPPPADTSGSDVYYANCTEARAAGAAPILRGEPGYRSGLDRDDDGIACET